MKTLLLTAIVLSFAGAQAFADGFVCNAMNGSLTVQIYDHTQAAAGTRTGAVMVLSDPEAKAGEKTIARFTDTNGLLSSSNTTYTADVDLRFKGVQNKEMLVAGKVHLEDLNNVVVITGFTYSDPLDQGETTEGTIQLNTRDGQQISLDADCNRYLKNPDAKN